MIPTISSTFTHYEPSSKALKGYKESFFYVLPKFLIFVNGNSFEFTESPNWLSVRAKLKQASFVYDLKRVLHIKKGNTITLAKYYADRPASYKTPSLPENPNLTDKERLFAFLCLLQDASIAYLYCDVDEFIEDFGYSENIKQVRKGEEMFRKIKDNTKKLGYTETEVTNMINELAEMGIE